MNMINSQVTIDKKTVLQLLSVAHKVLVLYTLQSQCCPWV